VLQRSERFFCTDGTTCAQVTGAGLGVGVFVDCAVALPGANAARVMIRITVNITPAGCRRGLFPKDLPFVFIVPPKGY
jgi:hypothetical protein